MKSVVSLNRFFLSVGLLLLLSSLALAQGVLVNENAEALWMPRVPRPVPIRPIPVRPVPELSYSIKSLEIAAEIKSQIAQVNVSQTFVNTGNRQMEVSFVFPLPYDGAIDSMVLLVDGKEYAAKLLDAKEARKTYEAIVRRNQDPALLEWIGTGMFKTSVFPVPAGAARTVSLKYTQLLRNDAGMTDLLIPLSTAKYTAKPVESLAISVSIETSDEMKNLYSPSHEVKIQKPTAKKAMVTLQQSNTVPSSDFRLFFDSASGDLSAKTLSYRPNEQEDGYFLLLASPKMKAEDTEVLPKTLVFVVDESSSMAGEKIVQAREALKFVLNNLREGDLFNIVRYASNVTQYKPELVSYNDAARAEALAYADSIRASGMTNIEAALKTAFSQIKDSQRPAYVLFLTDGCPTSGETNEMKLSELAKKSNSFGARLFAFGVGYDVNSRLLDRMVRDNRGHTEYVKPNENIELSVGRLFNRIGSPVLTDVTFEFRSKDSATPTYMTNRVYPSGKFDLFAGEQLVIAGRYSQPGPFDLIVRGKLSEKEQEYSFEGQLAAKGNNQDQHFLAKLWALRRIGEILDELDLKGQNEELVKELVELSTHHGILTPYTSFLADEGTQLTDFSANSVQARDLTSNLAAASGRAGFSQRSAKKSFSMAKNLDNQLMMEETKEAEFAMAPAQNDASDQLMMRGTGAMAPAQNHFGGMGGGSRRRVSVGMIHPSASQPARNQTTVADRAEKVRTVNGRTFFNKNDQWIDSTISETQLAPENQTVIKLFSDEYFDLMSRHDDLAAWLSLGGTQIVNLDGKAYRFE